MTVDAILRSDGRHDLAPGAVNAFSTAGSRIYADSEPIWLARSDWTALAEIDIVAQARAAGQVSGTFRVRHAYDGAEQEMMTAVLRRMFASEGDPHIYVLISEPEHLVAEKLGELYRDSLESEGFLHASPAAQLTRVADKFYRDATNPRILVVALDRIAAEVRWEPATGGLYPHIYGPLNMDAVDYAVPAPRAASGAFWITEADLVPARCRRRPV